jgi:hypothetical protein
MNIEVKKVDYPNRVHLDVESNDVEAEVKRLEAIEAKRLNRVEDWAVLEAATGHPFLRRARTHAS